jgi:N-ATPase, AtpR subunit
MIATLHLRPVLWAAIMVPAGFACGWAYFVALREGCARLLAGRRGVLVLAGLRLVAVAALLTLAAHRGATALLATFAGFLLARSLAVGRARRLVR